MLNALHVLTHILNNKSEKWLFWNDPNFIRKKWVTEREYLALRYTSNIRTIFWTRAVYASVYALTHYIKEENVQDITGAQRKSMPIRFRKIVTVKLQFSFEEGTERRTLWTGGTPCVIMCEEYGLCVWEWQGVLGAWLEVFMWGNGNKQS